MTKNYMENVAKILGLELYQPFRIANTNKLRRYLQEHPADLKKKEEYDKYMCLRVTAYDIEQKLTEEREELYSFARGKKNRDQKRMKYLIKRYENLKDWIQEDWRLEVE